MGQRESNPRYAAGSVRQREGNAACGARDPPFHERVVIHHNVGAETRVDRGTSLIRKGPPWCRCNACSPAAVGAEMGGG